MSHPVVARMESADPDERRAACREAATDPSAVLLLEALCERLGDAEKAVVRAASDAIVAIERDQPGQADALLRAALHGDSARRRWGAAFTRARLSPPEPGLIPAVVEAMAAADGDVRWAATKLLVEMGRLHPEVLGVAIGLARSADRPIVRRMAAFCLRELAPDDPHAAAALVEASRDESPELARAAFTALAALLDPPAAVPARLVEALQGDPDPILRRLAALSLGELGANNPGTLPAQATAELERARDAGADPDLRRAADRALQRLEERAC